MSYERIKFIKPFYVMEILQRARELERQGYEVIHLEVGEPDFNTPSVIIEEVKKKLDINPVGYTHSLGTHELRRAICDHYYQKYRVKIDPSQVIVTNGTSPAFLVALGCLICPGDEVILTNPHYPCYPNFINFLGGVPKYVPVLEEDGFIFDINRIKKAVSQKTKGVFINSPANPTGIIIPKDLMEEVANLGLWIFSDEIYHGLNYGEDVHTVLEFTDKCIVFNGFSKLYAMTGWRLGYMIVPKFIVPKIEAIVQNFYISPNAVSQWAGQIALTHPEVKKEIDKMVSIYNQRRWFIIHKLKETGFEIKVEPKGAFYVFVNGKKFMKDKTSYEFAINILEKTHVALTPGTDFGSQGEGFIRFSYANSIDNISKALNRIKKILKII